MVKTLLHCSLENKQNTNALATTKMTVLSTKLIKKPYNLMNIQYVSP